MARSVYSNEAGWGTSPMIHASAKTPHPVEQGLWGSFEVFFDTMVICTITALSVILSGNWTDGTNGGTLALSAFASGFGKFGSILLAVIMVIFTVTTSGGWFTYYLAILEHLYKKEGKMKAVVSITIDEEFVVHDIKVIEGEKGLFIAMPSRKSSDGEYRDIAHPINTQTRDKLQKLVLEAYDKAEDVEE